MNFLTEFQPVTIQPYEIEKKSFETIDQEIGEHSFSEDEYKVVQRIIHASADFDLGKSMLFHADAIRAGIDAIKAGKKIVCDVQMVEVGISKPRIQAYGCETKVYIKDPAVVEEAKKLQVTRSILAMRKAAREADGGIFLIGNAPTALLELIRLVKEGEAKPSLIVGVPVGFISAEESKDELAKLELPFITNRGRKGGSTIAVAAINAIAILAEKG